MPKGTPSGGNRCGTVGGATGHYKAGEPPCPSCRDAKSRYDAKRNAEPAVWAVKYHAAAAASAAKTALRQRYADEYAELYEQAKLDLAIMYLGDEAGQAYRTNELAKRLLGGGADE